MKRRARWTQAIFAVLWTIILAYLAAALVFILTGCSSPVEPPLPDPNELECNDCAPWIPNDSGGLSFDGPPESR